MEDYSKGAYLEYTSIDSNNGLVLSSHQWPLLLTWINFNPSMDK